MWRFVVSFSRGRRARLAGAETQVTCESRIFFSFVVQILRETKHLWHMRGRSSFELHKVALELKDLSSAFNSPLQLSLDTDENTVALMEAQCPLRQK
jgi:hypothetical protein